MMPVGVAGGGVAVQVVAPEGAGESIRRRKGITRRAEAHLQHLIVALGIALAQEKLLRAAAGASRPTGHTEGAVRQINRLRSVAVLICAVQGEGEGIGLAQGRAAAGPGRAVDQCQRAPVARGIRPAAAAAFVQLPVGQHRHSRRPRPAQGHVVQVEIIAVAADALKTQNDRGVARIAGQVYPVLHPTRLAVEAMDGVTHIHKSVAAVGGGLNLKPIQTAAIGRVVMQPKFEKIGPGRAEILDRHKQLPTARTFTGIEARLPCAAVGGLYRRAAGCHPAPPTTAAPGAPAHRRKSCVVKALAKQCELGRGQRGVGGGGCPPAGVVDPKIV